MTNTTSDLDGLVFVDDRPLWPSGVQSRRGRRPPAGLPTPGPGPEPGLRAGGPGRRHADGPQGLLTCDLIADHFTE